MRLLLGLLAEKPTFKIRSCSSSISGVSAQALVISLRHSLRFSKEKFRIRKTHATLSRYISGNLISPWNVMFDRTIPIFIKTCVSKLHINICVIPQRSLLCRVFSCLQLNMIRLVFCFCLGAIVTAGSHFVILLRTLTKRHRVTFLQEHIAVTHFPLTPLFTSRYSV